MKAILTIKIRETKIQKLLFQTHITPLRSEHNPVGPLLHINQHHRKKTTITVTKYTKLPEESNAAPKKTTSKQIRSHGSPDPNVKNNGTRRHEGSTRIQIVITLEGDNSFTAIGYAKG